MLGLTTNYYWGKDKSYNIDTDFKLVRLLSLNYTACLNLIQTCESYTGYKVLIVSASNEITIVSIKDEEYMVISRSGFLFWNLSLSYTSSSFPNITEESYKKIKNLCNKLFNDYA